MLTTGAEQTRKFIVRQEIIGNPGQKPTTEIDRYPAWLVNLPTGSNSDSRLVVFSLERDGRPVRTERLFFGETVVDVNKRLRPDYQEILINIDGLACQITVDKNR